jgi:hypothetical protein
MVIYIYCPCADVCQSAVYPGSSLQYIEVIESPRYEDFEIQYLHKNPWAHLGMGASLSNVVQGADLSPYLQLENIDPKWLKAIGYESAASEVQEERNAKEKTETNGEVRGSRGTPSNSETTNAILDTDCKVVFMT